MTEETYVLKCTEFLLMQTLRDHFSIAGVCTSSLYCERREPVPTKKQKVIAMFNLVIAMSYFAIAMCYED